MHPPDNYTVYHTNPINSWVKMQWESYRLSALYADCEIHYLSGRQINQSESLWRRYYHVKYLCRPGKSQRGQFTHGFVRQVHGAPRTDNGVNSFPFLAGIYIDSTRARVMLGDHQDCHPVLSWNQQIHSAWNQNEITYQCQPGGFL